MERAEMQGGDYAKFKRAAVLVIIMFFHRKYVPSTLWSDILQIGLDIIY